MRVAIVHYWLVGMRGGERVLEEICRLFPDADIFTHVYDPAAVSDYLRGRNVRTTFIQKLPWATRSYQTYLPLMPLALEQLDLTAYDLVITSEAGPAKGVILRPDAVQLCYCHSPMRYVWDQYHVYRAEAGLITRTLLPLLTHRLRLWDTSSAQRVDHVVANSRYIAQRVAKCWRREASVVHPPVSVGDFSPGDAGEEFLWAGQMVPYKRPDIAVEAFTTLGLPLLMLGDGPMRAKLMARAGPTVRFVERLSYSELQQAYAHARALVFTAEEDFGIIPVEAQAAGRPVIAFGRGGALETVIERKTGLFFREQTSQALTDALRQFESWESDFRASDALANAQRFSVQAFREGFIREVLAACPGAPLVQPALQIPAAA